MAQKSGRGGGSEGGGASHSSLGAIGNIYYIQDIREYTIYNI